MRTSPLVAGLVAAGLILTLLPPVTAASPVFIDNFSVVKNGTVLFNDPFSDGIPPPNAPNFANGTPASYFVPGDFTGKEGGGLLRLDTAGAFVGANSFRLQQALLLTNVDPNNLALGFKVGEVTNFVTVQNYWRDLWFDQKDPTWAGRPS